MLRQGQLLKAATQPAAAAQAAAASSSGKHQRRNRRRRGGACVVERPQPGFLRGKKGVLVLMRRRYTGFSSDSVAWDSNELVLNFTLGVRKSENRNAAGHTEFFINPSDKN